MIRSHFRDAPPAYEFHILRNEAATFIKKPRGSLSRRVDGVKGRTGLLT